MSNVTVLHVDDEPGPAETTATLLEHVDERLSVDVETDPTEAVERVGRFDCVVTDYEMPDVDGIDLLRRARERYPDLPVVLYTASEDESVEREARDAGADGVLRKQAEESYERLASAVVEAAGR